MMIKKIRHAPEETVQDFQCSKVNPEAKLMGILEMCCRRDGLHMEVFVQNKPNYQIS